MFYSIPVNNEQIITTSPLEARSITHVFFESKNDGIFNYKRDYDKVTITVDGKMICRDVPILPFTSSTTYGINRHKWQDVALEVGLNVNLSEIKISAQVINDFNVVFVCSNTELKETKGFDFVECKRFKLREALTTQEREKQLNNVIDELVKNGTATAWGETFSYPYVLKVIEENNEEEKTLDDYLSVESITVQLEVGKKIILKTSEEYRDHYTLTSTETDTGYKQLLTYTIDELDYLKSVLQAKQLRNLSEYTYANWGRENMIGLDRAPERMFIYQLKSETENANKPRILMPSDVVLNFTISGTDNEEFPPKTDMALVLASDNIAWRKNAHVFSQVMPRSFMFTYDYQVINDYPISRTYMDEYSQYAMPQTWDLYVCFIYKKLL